VVLLLLFQALVFALKWNTLGPDILLYYTFSHKSLYEVAEFWFLFLILGFFHESAHGLTCKHYGGEVHSMGLMFLYLTPCFFVDVTEGWISATRVQRMATIIAGIWVEMTICGVAMIVWINTQRGQWIHDFAYEIILLTGIAVVVINLNPLIKLDGYHLLTEMVGIPDLKERSTAFLSGWFQSRVLRIPVDVPIVQRRRVGIFALYAFASGLYSYVLLFAVIRFTYNLASNWIAEFALIPAGGLAYGVFRSRLRSFGDVSARFREHHFGDFRWRPIHLVGAVAILALLFVPIWRDRENAFFLIEPEHSATIHAAAQGRVDAVLVKEGEPVSRGQPLLRMTSTVVSSMASSAAARTDAARYQAFGAQVQRQSIGSASATQDEAARDTDLAAGAQSSLLLRAPADSVVITPDPAALLNQNVSSGEPLLSLASAGPRVARIFIPGSALDRVPAGAEVALALPGKFSVVRLRLGPMDGEAVSLPPGLVPKQDYKGIVMPTFYNCRIALPAPWEDLPLGSSGEAKIFGQRRSLFQRTVAVVLNLVRAHIW
jgi:putative peptide zinc metalloprotease protein